MSDNNKMSKMNNNTHKVLSVTRKECVLVEFAVPNGWEISDLEVKGDKLYYKGVLQEVPMNGPDREEEPVHMHMWGGGKCGGVEDCFECDTN